MKSCIKHMKYKKIAYQRSKRKFYFDDTKILVLKNVKQKSHLQPIDYIVPKGMYV